jgi:hypothetical protein
MEDHRELERLGGQWRITHRTTRFLGHAEARRAFETALSH